MSLKTALDPMKTAGTILVMALLTFPLKSQEMPKLTSHPFEWMDLPVKKTNSGERRQVFEGHTNTLPYFEVHATTLHPDQAPHESHVHQDMEELIIVKEGKILQSINGESKVLVAGSVALASPGDRHGISNAGDKDATYYILRWRSSEGPDLQRSGMAGGSAMYDWNEMEAVPTEKGFHRQVMKRPTACLEELEMHVTTLKKGITSHAEHVHADEEMVIVLHGHVESSINGHKTSLGPGSLVLLTDMDSHGVRNDGESECEYFAFRWK